jgi:hypothetical protein
MLGAAAPAQAGERADFETRFAEQATGAVTALTLHVRYKAAGGDPEAKPSPIRKVVLDAPAGTSFGNGHPVCAASDEELRALGRFACAAETQIGTGTVTAITGVTPIDPFVGDLTLYAMPDGFFELAQAKDTNATVAVERLTVAGTRITAHPAIPPGGPPDGRSGVSTIDFEIAPNGFVVTPTDCPASGVWTWRGTFTFDDGTTVSESNTTPCAALPGGPPVRTGRLEVAPRRVKAGRRTRVRIDVPTVARCRAGHFVHLGGAVVETDADGEATLVTRLRPGRHRVTTQPPAEGCISRAGWVRARR